jgi:hypothetical protein
MARYQRPLQKACLCLMVASLLIHGTSIASISVPCYQQNTSMYRYNNIPSYGYGPIQFAVGGDLEDDVHMTISRPQSTDAGDWYTAYIGGMNMTAPNGRARMPTIMVRNQTYVNELVKVINHLTYIKHTC